jgi:hypothetical protein
VGKRRSAGGQDLDKGVHVLHLVGVLGRMGVHALHPLPLGRPVGTRLCGVDVVVHAVQQGADHHGGDADGQCSYVVQLVHLAGADGVVV